MVFFFMLYVENKEDIIYIYIYISNGNSPKNLNKFLGLLPNPKRFIFMLNQVPIQIQLLLYNNYHSIRCNQNRFHHQFLQVTQNF